MRHGARLLTLAAILVPCTASAGPVGGGKPPAAGPPAGGPSADMIRQIIFPRRAADADGVISEKAFVTRSIHKANPAGARALFARMDKDKDGKVTVAEYVKFLDSPPPPGPRAPAGPPKGPPKPPAPAGGQADPDAGYKRIFRRLDADADGAVTEKEYVSRTRWPQAKARAIWRASDGDGDGKVTEAEYCYNRRVTDEAKKVFTWLDADRDGKVTEAEPLAAARKLSQAMDKTRDGSVTIPEFLRTRWEWKLEIQWQPPAKPAAPAGQPAGVPGPGRD